MNMQNNILIGLLKGKKICKFVLIKYLRIGYKDLALVKTLNLLGIICTLQDSATEAIEYYEEAIVIYKYSMFSEFKGANINRISVSIK
jgi:hypothetical protein